MLVEIKHRLSGSVLFSVEAGALRLAVEIAVKQRANLYGADLYGANLSGADLYGANLSGADHIIRVGPTSDGYEFVALPGDDGVMVKAGCHWFTLAEAKAYYKADKRSVAPERRAFIALIEAVVKARGWATKAVKKEAA